MGDKWWSPLLLFFHAGSFTFFLLFSRNTFADWMLHPHPISCRPPQGIWMYIENMTLSLCVNIILTILGQIVKVNVMFHCKCILVPVLLSENFSVKRKMVIKHASRELLTMCKCCYLPCNLMNSSISCTSVSYNFNVTSKFEFFF